MIRLLRNLFVLAAVFTTPVSAQQGITPCASGTLAVSNTSANVALNKCGETALLWNVGTQEAFYKLVTTNAGTAATTDNSLPGNSFVVINVGSAPLFLAAITSTSTTNIRITQGLTR